MKRIVPIVVTFLLVIMASMAAAAPLTITVEWGYTPPSEPAVTGFRLYQEGTAVCWWARANSRKGACEIEGVSGESDSFTLTATFSDANGSVWTDAYCSDPKYLDESSCEGASETWADAVCSNKGYIDEVSCEGNESPHSTQFTFTPGARTLNFVWLKPAATTVPMSKPQGAKLR